MVVLRECRAVEHHDIVRDVVVSGRVHLPTWIVIEPPSFRAVDLKSHVRHRDLNTIYLGNYAVDTNGGPFDARA